MREYSPGVLALTYGMLVLICYAFARAFVKVRR